MRGDLRGDVRIAVTCRREAFSAPLPESRCSQARHAQRLQTIAEFLCRATVFGDVPVFGQRLVGGDHDGVDADGASGGRGDDEPGRAV